MIYGNGIRFRWPERDDLPRFVEWINDPEVRSGIARDLPLNLAAEEQWFQHAMNKPEVERPFAIEMQEGDFWRLAGSCGYFNLDWVSRQAELGIMIGDRSIWDRGIGTRAMRLLLEHGFNTLNLKRVYLKVFESNERAIHLYRKLGFVQEGRFRQAHFSQGRYWDTFQFGMLKSEYVSGRAEAD